MHDPQRCVVAVARRTPLSARVSFKFVTNPE